MLRSCVIVATLSILATSARADVTKHRTARVIGVGIALGVFVTSELVKSDLAADPCRWCKPPGIDGSVRDALVWSDPKLANTLANATGYVASPLGVAALVFAASRERKDSWSAFLDDTLAVAEASLYAQMVVQTIKFSVGRQRPFARYDNPAYGAAAPDDNLSFVSGHTALTVSLMTSAGLIAHDRGYALEPAVWITGGALAVTTGYLRIAADKHYLTDVLGGALVGAIGGIVIPRLTGALPANVAVMPTGNGVAVSAAW